VRIGERRRVGRGGGGGHEHRRERQARDRQRGEPREKLLEGEIVTPAP
jgi:hypothetical protein